MGSIEIHVTVIRITQYFCINISTALATLESIVYWYYLTHILRIADTALIAVEVFLNFPNSKFFPALFLLCFMNSFDNFTVT